MKKRPNKTIVPYSKVRIAEGRLFLRPYGFSDFKTLKASHDQRLSLINKFDEPVAAAKEPDLVKFKKRVERYRKLGKKRHQFIFGIFNNKSGDFIGQIDLFVINKQLRWGNLGYHIQNQHFNNGYAMEAAKLGLKIGFKFLDFHRIEASTEPENEASQRVALKAGLIFEGKRRKFFADNGGTDMLVYATNAIDHK